jgi:hypothetical protein
MTMSKKETILERIERAAEENDWKVTHSECYRNPSDLDVEFETYTSTGQDFIVSATLRANNPSTLIEDLRSRHDGFDPDYEASLWIGPDGHWLNGAPYHIKDIVDDMKEAGEMLGDLLSAMEHEFN